MLLLLFLLLLRLAEGADSQTVPLTDLYSKQDSDNQAVNIDVDVEQVPTKEEEEEEMDVSVKSGKEERKKEKVEDEKEKSFNVIRPRRPSLTLLPPPSKPASESQFSDISDASDGENEKRAAGSPVEPPKISRSHQQSIPVSKVPNGVTIPTICTPSDQEDKGKLSQQPPLPLFDAVRSPQPQIARDEKDIPKASSSNANQESVPDSQPSSPKDGPSYPLTTSSIRSNLLNTYSTSQGTTSSRNLTCNSIQDQRHSYAGTHKTKSSNVSGSSQASPKHTDHADSPLNTLAEMAVERSAQGEGHSSRLLSSGSTSSREDDTRRDRDTGNGGQQPASRLTFDTVHKSTENHRGSHSHNMIKMESSSRATVAYCAPGSAHSVSQGSDDTRDSDSSGSGSLSPRTRRTTKKQKGHREQRKGVAEGSGRGHMMEVEIKEEGTRMPNTPAMIQMPFNFSVPCQPISPGGEVPSSSAHGDKLMISQYNMHSGGRPKKSSSPNPSRQTAPSFTSHPVPPSLKEKELSTSLTAGGPTKRSTHVITNSSGTGLYHQLPAQYSGSSASSSMLLGVDTEKERSARKRKPPPETVNAAASNKRFSPSPSISRETDNAKPLPPLPASFGRVHHLSSVHEQIKPKVALPGFDFDPSLPMSYDMQVLAYHNQQQQQNKHHALLEPVKSSSSAPQVVHPKRPRSTDPPPNRQLIQGAQLSSPSSPSSAANNRYSSDVSSAASTSSHSLLDSSRLTTFPTASITQQQRPRSTHIDSIPGRSHSQQKSASGQQTVKKPSTKRIPAELPPVQVKPEPENPTLPPWQLFGAANLPPSIGIQFSPHILSHGQIPSTPPSTQAIASPMAGIPQMPFSWAPGVIPPTYLQPGPAKQIKVEHPSPGIGRPDLVPPNSMHRTRSPSPSVTKKQSHPGSSHTPDHHHPSVSQVVIPQPTRPSVERKSSRPQFSGGKISSSSHSHSSVSSSSSTSSSSRSHHAAPKAEPVVPRPQLHPQIHIPHHSMPQQSPTHLGESDHMLLHQYTYNVAWLPLYVCMLSRPPSPPPLPTSSPFPLPSPPLLPSPPILSFFLFSIAQWVYSCCWYAHLDGGLCQATNSTTAGDDEGIWWCHSSHANVTSFSSGASYMAGGTDAAGSSSHDRYSC